MTRRSRRFAGVPLPLALVLTVSACGDSPSITTGGSPQARHIAGSWWLLLWLATGVYVIVGTLVVVASVRRARRRSGGEQADRGQQDAPAVDNRFILIGGLIVPVVILGVVAVDTVRVANRIAPAAAAPDAPVQIRVEGERWWWRVEYPDEGVVTANEIHVPIGEEVDITLVSDNVIHSLWIPQLNGKQDMIPGQVNHLRFTADREGTFLGRCAEFCGVQHAHMQFQVHAESPARYDAWLRANGADATSVAGDAARTGRTFFETSSCAGCHTVRGTSANGTAGPDLTHVGSRATLAAGSLPNTAAGMEEWLAHTQSVKPGSLMPQVPLTTAQIESLVAFLRGLQ